nr:cation:proton antiporter [Azospirillum sp. INR13]
MAAPLALASLIGLLGLLLRQPLIVSFIGVGILAGPSVLGLVQSTEHIELLAEIGIAVLLFLVGLKLDVKLVRTLGAVALGFLIVQDLVVVLAMVVLSAYGVSAGGSRSGLGIAEVAGSGILLLAAGFRSRPPASVKPLLHGWRACATSCCYSSSSVSVRGLSWGALATNPAHPSCWRSSCWQATCDPRSLCG